MARRFALALVAILALLLGAFLVMRSLRAPKTGATPAPAPRPTAVVPPTPIPARNVTLFFESQTGDGVLHPESRDVPAASDDVAFLRSVASGVVEGPRSPDLVRPFPDGWSLRGAYLLRDGVAVLDLAPPRPPAPSDASPGARGPAVPTPVGPSAWVRWQAGGHEEDMAVQALAVTVGRNMTAVTRVVLLVAGEPADTLAGHVDLAHPIAPDFTRAAEETPRPAQTPPTPSPSASPTAEPTATPAPSKAPRQTKPPPRPKGETT